MDKLVSVVVTCYNHENYILECLNSIFNQSYQNIELFVYNDGSTDGSDCIIKESLKKSPFKKTQYITQKNKGLVITRNQAFDLISGEYLLFVDSDNYLEANYLEEMIRTAESEEADIVYTKLISIDSKTTIYTAPSFELSKFYSDNFIDSCSLIRVSKIINVRYDENLNYKKLEDYDFFWNLIVNNGAKAFPCRTTHLNYRILDNSMSARGDLRKYYEPYSYILGKYFLQHPDFAREAMKINFLRLEEMMNLESPYEKQEISVFFDFGKGFSEEKKLGFSLLKEGTICFKLPDFVEHVRIDFSELPVYMKIVEVKIEETGELLLPGISNGISIESGISFLESDPMVVYKVSGKSGETIQVNYERFSINDPNSKNYVAKSLATSYDRLHKDFDEVYNSFQESQRLFKDLQASFDTLQTEYNSIISSRRWTIPTRIINFIRRKK